MQITKSQERDTTILAFTGHLDTKTSKAAEDAVNAALDAGAVKLGLDFTALEYISSAGLRVLLATMKRIKKAGGKLHLWGMNPTVKEVFVISGFSNIFSMFDGRAAALAAMG